MPYDLLSATLAPLATMLPVLLSALVAFVLVLACAPDRDDTARWDAIVVGDEREEATRRRLTELTVAREWSTLTNPPPVLPRREAAALAVLVARYGRRRAAWIMAA